MEGRTGNEGLRRAECLRILDRATIGRLVAVDGTTVVVGLRYQMDEAAVVLRTAPGTVGIPVGSLASFEVEAAEGHVVVTGHLEELGTWAAATCERLHVLASARWSGGPMDRWLRLQPIAIHGERVGSERLAS